MTIRRIFPNGKINHVVQNVVIIYSVVVVVLLMKNQKLHLEEDGANFYRMKATIPPISLFKCLQNFSLMKKMQSKD